MEFCFIYHAASSANEVAPDEIQFQLKSWLAWFSAIEKAGRLIDRGLSLRSERCLVESATELSNSIANSHLIEGFSIVRARNLHEAKRFAQDCPILKTGGVVEVREMI